MITQTISAIATPHGTGGVGIIRISGDNAVAVADKIYKGKPVSTMQSHTMHLGKIIHNNNVIDEALICFFKAPNSYTGEDIVEIYCHGGISVCKLILNATIANGAKIANAGEFTRRAFINGKLDLSQAEAVADIIDAQTDDSVLVAANQLSGTLSKKISIIRDDLLNSTGHLVATLDFSEEGVEDLPYDTLKEKMLNTKNQIDKLLKTSDDGRIIKDGVNIAIIGSPNVGKSSLLNVISGEDRAIVTDIAGTTRDILETSVNIRGCKVNLLDTAGIRQSADIVEQLGVERSKSAIEKADLVLLMLDGTRKLSDEDYDVINIVDKTKTICLINKCDIKSQCTIDMDGFIEIINISAKTGEGIDNLFSIIHDKYSKGDIASNVIITNNRHKECLITASSLLSHIINSMDNFAPADIVLSDIELVILALGEISGLTVSDEIIDNIFTNFCVGK